MPPNGGNGPSFIFWRSWVHATVIWAPHSLIVSSLAIFWYNYHFAATFKSWPKLTKRRSDLANFGLKMVEKNRLFLGFSAITSSRLEIAPCKGARLWNLRTKPTSSHQLILIILCVGGARDFQKTPFFQPKRVTVKRWLRFHNIKLFWLKFRTYTNLNPLNPKKRSFLRSDMF